MTSEVMPHRLRDGFFAQPAKAGLNAVAIKRLARRSDTKTNLCYIEVTEESFREGLEEAFR